MSRTRALDTIHLKPVDRLAHTEYSLMYHPATIREVTGLAPDDPGAERALYDAWDLDFIFGVSDGLRGDWQNLGRATDMGHAVYTEDGSDQRAMAECSFRTPEEVWAFDAVTEYGLPSFEEQVAAYQQHQDRARSAFPNQLTTGGYYRTIVSGAIAAFGWDMFLMALSEPTKMEPVLDSFFRRTLFHMEAWAATDAEVIIQHDDFVWTSGPFMRPELYRQLIIPRYAELWKLLHAAGKKVLFCSDGNFTEFAGDIVEAGADGLIFEPMNDFDWMVDRFGRSHGLVGSAVDCRDLTFGKWDKVQADLDHTFERAADCKGLIFAVGNHLPANIPDEVLRRFIAAFMEKCGG